MAEFIYGIEGYGPDSMAERGDFGFLVLLDRGFARRAIQTKLPSRARSVIMQEATSIVKTMAFGKEQKKPYHFVPMRNGKESCLLQFCEVEGNACDLSLDINTLDELREEQEGDPYNIPIKYGTHNVGGNMQAYALLSIWLVWANTMRDVLAG